MITALKTIIGLIFDDWWMAIGLLISILISYFAIQSGLDVQMSGWLLLILMIGALILSLNVEYRKKSKKR
jgi:FtsH-binding integral membrane protein